MSWKCWRVPMRLARRELWRRPGRSLLVAIVVALPVTALVLLDVQYRSRAQSVDDRRWVAAQWGSADALATIYSEQCPSEQCSRTDVEARLPDGSTVLWAKAAQLPIRVTEGAPKAFVGVTSVDMTQPITNGLSTLTSGRWPAAADEVAMPREIMDELGIDESEPFSLLHQSRTFRVVGVIDESDGWGRSLVAPGFDFTVVREEAQHDYGYIDLPDGLVATPMLFDEELSVSPRPAPTTYSDQSDDNRELVLGWLGGVLAMSVLGVVVAAAFAISGRRQLVTIGQLSASGADQRMLTRTLGLQGTVTGTVGAALGLVAALVVHLQWPFALFGTPAGDTIVAAPDIVVIALTAIAVATIAALAPTRSLARVSVLTALAGRRPAGKVPATMVRNGAVLFVGGLVVAVAATRSGSNGGGAESGMLVAVGMIAAVLGVCALSPMLVDRLAGVTSHGGAALRLASRGVARHRPRAAAVFASLLLVGMAATGVAAIAEYGLRTNDGFGASLRGDLIQVQAQLTHFVPDVNSPSVPATVPEFAEVRASVDAEVRGSVEWYSTPVAYSTAADVEFSDGWFLVVDETTLGLFGIPAAERDEVMASETGVLVTKYEYGSQGGQFATKVVPEMTVDIGRPMISEGHATALGLTVVADARYFGIADHALTYDEALAVQAQSTLVDDRSFYIDGREKLVVTEFLINRWPDTNRTLTDSETRWLILGSTSLLVTLMVAFGMALWAVEGRDERDVLVAVGASPASMARVAAWRAGGLTFGAMLPAVPLGLFIAWTIASAARTHVDVPWVLGGALLLVVPTLIGGGAWACSALAQRLRPVTMSSLTLD